MFEKEYGNDMDMGALDYDEIEGDLDPNTCAIIKQLIINEKQDDGNNLRGRSKTLLLLSSL